MTFSRALFVATASSGKTGHEVVAITCWLHAHVWVRLYLLTRVRLMLELTLC